MPKKIRVRPGLLANLTEAEYCLYQKVLAYFTEFSTHGTHLEKLYSHTAAPLYSIRANKEVRLILTPIKHKDEQYWLWIDIFEHHQYELLATRSNSWLAQQIKKTIEYDVDFAAVSTSDELHKEVELQEAQGIEFHQQRFIVLDDFQQEAINSTLPLVISGAPGSGKSCVVLLAMKQLIQQSHAFAADNKPRTLLYVAQSAGLVRFMASEWQAIVTLEFPLLTGYQVEFKTPEQLYLDIINAEARPSAYIQPPLVDHAFFYQWFAAYKETHRHLYTQQKEHELFMLLTAQTGKMYQEFRTASGYSSYAEYNGAIGRHSLFSDEAERKTVWTIFQHYRDSLSKSNHIDLAFFQGLVPTGRDFIILDEGQDFSRAQLHDFVASARNQQLLIAVGEHQRLQGSESTIPYIKSLYWPECTVNHISLTNSYRCPAKIVQVANAVLQFKYHAIGGTLMLDRKHELLFINTTPGQEHGEVHWLDSAEQLTPLSHDQDNAHFAVITLSEFKEEAQALFGRERVFTVQEIKGLEYRDVLLYRILDNEGFKAVNALIGASFQLWTNAFEAVITKNSMGNIAYNVIFNGLFVAITRAQRSLAFYQPKVDAIRNIRTPLMHLAKENNNASLLITPVHSSSEEWSVRAKALISQGQVEQAQAIDKKLTRMKEQQKAPLMLAPLLSLEKKQAASVAELSAKENDLMKSIAAESKEYQTFAKRILTRDASAVRQLLMHAKAKKYLFELRLPPTMPQQRAVSIFQWLMTNNGSLLLTKAAHAILKDMVKAKKPSAAEIARRAAFISLLFITQGVALGQQTIHSLLALILHEIKISESMLTYIIKHAVAAELIACVNASWYKGMNLVICAAENNDSILIGALTKLGADLNQPLDDGSTAAYIAAEMGYEKVLIKLHQLGADIERRSTEGVSPLFIAAAAGHINIIEVCHKLGINLHAFSPFGTSVASVAAHRGHVDLLNILHQLGGNFNSVTVDGQSAALIAAANNKADVLTVLHQLGYNLTLPGSDGLTPITVAILNNKIDALNRLVHLGVDINSRNHLGMTLAFPIIQLDMPLMLGHLHHLGINLNAQALDGTTVAHLATYTANCSMLKQLYQCNANLNIADSDGITPLFNAILYEREAMVVYLLDCLKMQDRASLACILDITRVRKMSILNNQGVRARYEEIAQKKKSACGKLALITPFEIAYIRGHSALIKLFADTGKASELGFFALATVSSTAAVGESSPLSAINHN